MTSFEPGPPTEPASTSNWLTEKWDRGKGPEVTYGPQLRPAWVVEAEKNASGEIFHLSAGFKKVEIGEDANQLPYYEIVSVRQNQARGAESFTRQGPSGLRFYSENEAKDAAASFAELVNTFTDNTQMAEIGYDPENRKFVYKAPPTSVE